MSKFIALSIFVIVLGASQGAQAHGGRTDRYGCHTDSVTGSYHCHGTSGGSTTSSGFTAEALFGMSYAIAGLSTVFNAFGFFLDRYDTGSAFHVVAILFAGGSEIFLALDEVRRNFDLGHLIAITSINSLNLILSIVGFIYDATTGPRLPGQAYLDRQGFHF